MYKQGIYTIAENKTIAKDVFLMVLQGDTSFITAPGQFVNIQLAGKYLRRPISICDWNDTQLTLIYKVVGGGTQQMSQMNIGDSLDLLTGLGNGFSVADCHEQTLLVGGGVGVPPMYGVAKKLIAAGKTPVVVMGFASKEDVFYKEAFEALGCTTYVATVDGSYGTKGFVTTAIEENHIDYTHYCACGPEPMLKALYNLCGLDGQLSFEERMGCGFGACMGCSCATKYGNKRICKEGPVLKGEEIIW